MTGREWASQQRDSAKIMMEQQSHGQLFSSPGH
jgi:hypothetical protein